LLVMMINFDVERLC